MAELAQLAVSLELQTAAFQKGFDQAQAAMTRFEQQGRRLNQSVQNMSGALAGVAKSAMQAVAAFASLETIKFAVGAGDTMRGLEASFKALTGSGEDAADMMQKTKASAQALGLPIQDVAGAAQKLTIGLREIGGSNEDVRRIVESFAMLGRVGGTSMEDVNGAMV
jgi:hypothetical protein